MVWDEVKQVATKKSTKGTFGYEKDLCLGAEIFVKIYKHLKDSESELAHFNEDTELREALITKSTNPEMF